MSSAITSILNYSDFLIPGTRADFMNALLCYTITREERHKSGCSGFQCRGSGGESTGRGQIAACRRRNAERSRVTAAWESNDVVCDVILLRTADEDRSTRR